MVVSVGYLLLAGIASAQGPVTDAVINREIQNGQERAAMNALTGAPGASGTAPAAVKVALVIQVPPGYPIENFGYGQLQAADASQNDSLSNFHALCQCKFSVSPDTANQTVTATFNPYPGAGPCAGHTYKVILFDGLGGNNPHQVARLRSPVQIRKLRIAASGSSPTRSLHHFTPPRQGRGVPCNPRAPA